MLPASLRKKLAGKQYTPPPPFVFADTPWLGAPHDGYGLVSFKDYEGIRVSASERSNPQIRAAMLQAHLTFGLLEAVIESKVPESALLRTITTNNGNEDANSSAPRTVMTSTNIISLLSDWRSRIRALGTSEQAYQWAARVQTVLRQARQLLQIEVLRPQLSTFRAANLDAHQYAQIMIQIGSLAEMLVSSSYAFPADSPRQGFSWSFILTPHRAIKDNMLLRGWCPFTIEILSETVKTLAYASICEPVVRGSSIGHRQCSQTTCVVNNISNPDGYQSKHVEPSCTCQKLAVGEGVIELLSAEQVPVIVTDTGTANGRLGAAKASSAPYVAISHVWADGLGSTAEVGLPACQINRLDTMVRKILPSGTFWIDSLCVPELKAMRKRAIGLMAQTYRDAVAVLVLDSTILSSSLSVPRELKLLRILSSGWMQRLWTLQEGILAKEIFFAFADGQATLAELIPSGDELFNGLASDLASEMFRLQKHKEHNLNISDVSRALRWRTTSKLGDETLAIAGLLKIDAFTLAGLPAEKRMTTFLLGIRQLPYNIIFLSGPKLDEPFFHWAPKSFMRAAETSLSFGFGEVICTPTGLLAEYAVIHFSDTTVDNRAQWFIRDSTRNRIYKVIDMYLGDKAEMIGVPAAYCCNIVLLIEVPRAYQMTFCAAVSGRRSESSVDLEGEDPRIICDFQKRMLVQHISEDEFGREALPLLVEGKSGRMRVKIV
ncbi:hypothetical protein BDW71DRAFT_185432 [Aspergillus fruticulosus]